MGVDSNCNDNFFLQVYLQASLLLTMKTRAKPFNDLAAKLDGNGFTEGHLNENCAWCFVKPDDGSGESGEMYRRMDGSDSFAHKLEDYKDITSGCRKAAPGTDCPWEHCQQEYICNPCMKKNQCHGCLLLLKKYDFLSEKTGKVNSKLTPDIIDQVLKVHDLDTARRQHLVQARLNVTKVVRTPITLRSRRCQFEDNIKEAVKAIFQVDTAYHEAVQELDVMCTALWDRNALEKLELSTEAASDDEGKSVGPSEKL